ncbi:hypothetical protein RB623_08000 [Mesorhizobium sp. LHD-90]|uniref:hypothetical protein n=1 Tax=Mesorhizobium sp. LHD-90 TaxID=3071414 RepID=UPI0027DF5B6B|nr:hypothetical protein [Mesorhizobium sp. LHD-90]MDQ6433987.1 hypothetical protein [Mesorhizobium sp. LHD-90]
MNWISRLLLVIGLIGTVVPFTPWGLTVGLWFDPNAFVGSAELGAPKPVPELNSIGNIALPAFGGWLLLYLLRAVLSRRQSEQVSRPGQEEVRGR